MKNYNEMAETVLERIEDGKYRRKRRWRISILAVLGCCVLAFLGLKLIFVMPGPYMMSPSGSEGIYPEITLEDFYRNNAYILQGTVTGIKEDYFLNPLDIRGRDNARITIYEMKITEAFKGDLPGDTVLIRVVNGQGIYTAWYNAAVKAGDIDELTLEVGKEYILPLGQYPYDNAYYNSGDFYVYGGDHLLFTQDEKGAWRTNGLYDLTVDPAAMQAELAGSLEEVIGEAELVVKATVLEEKEPYFTAPNEQNVENNAYTLTYTLQVDEVLKGRSNADELILKAYDTGSVVTSEYYRQEIESGQIDLLELESGGKYIFCLQKIPEELAESLGEEQGNYQLLELGGGKRGAIYKRRACYQKDDEGLYRNLDDPTKILNPETLKIEGE